MPKDFYFPDCEVIITVYPQYIHNFLGRTILVPNVAIATENLEKFIPEHYGNHHPDQLIWKVYAVNISEDIAMNCNVCFIIIILCHKYEDRTSQCNWEPEAIGGNKKSSMLKQEEEWFNRLDNDKSAHSKVGKYEK